MTIDVNLFYPMLFLLILFAGYGIYHIILTILANKNSQDTTTKFQLMYNKSSDTQKELQLDVTDKLSKIADNVIRLPYTNKEAQETHQINKEIKDIKLTIEKIKAKISILENK